MKRERQRFAFVDIVERKTVETNEQKLESRLGTSAKGEAEKGRAAKRETQKLSASAEAGRTRA